MRHRFGTIDPRVFQWDVHLYYPILINKAVGKGHLCLPDYDILNFHVLSTATRNAQSSVPLICWTRYRETSTSQVTGPERPITSKHVRLKSRFCTSWTPRYLYSWLAGHLGEHVARLLWTFPFVNFDGQVEYNHTISYNIIYNYCIYNLSSIINNIQEPSRTYKWNLRKATKKRLNLVGP